MELAALKQAAAAATPGKWTYFPKPKYNEHHVSVPIEGSGFQRGLFQDGCGSDRPEEDAKFIALANPQSVLELIDSHERLIAALAKLLPLASGMNDAGLVGQEYQSDALILALIESRAAISLTTEEPA